MKNLCFRFLLCHPDLYSLKGRKSSTECLKCSPHYGGSISNMIEGDRLRVNERKRLARSMISDRPKEAIPDVLPFEKSAILEEIYKNIMDPLYSSEKINWVYDYGERGDFIRFAKFVNRYIPKSFLLSVGNENEIATKVFTLMSNGKEISNIFFLITSEETVQADFYSALKKLNYGLLVPKGSTIESIDFECPNIYVLSGQDLPSDCKLGNPLFEYKITINGREYIGRETERYKEIMSEYKK